MERSRNAVFIRENHNESHHSDEIRVTEKMLNERLAKYERYFEKLESQG